ncbi:MAG TPA: hypothetical protein VJ872_16165 [Nocardioides sp.]|nr:hypothetical protein [Nocardioides sp.]
MNRILRRVGLIALAIALAQPMAPSGPAVADTAANGVVLPPLNPAPQVDQGRLTGVDCPSTHDCVAVGTGGTGFVERWDGTSWSLSKVPAADSLTAIGCAGNASCVAVGTYGDQAVAFRVTPGGVTPVALPSLTRVTLDAVSCPTVSFCAASGSRLTFDSTTGTTETPAVVVVTSSGATEATLPAVGDRLTGVSCTSASDCTTVGVRDYFSRSAQALLEHFDGTSWSVVPLPPDPGKGGLLTSVSCPAAGRCVAAGHGMEGNLVAWQQSSSGWTEHRVGDFDTPGPFVSCPAVDDCLITTTFGGSYRGSGDVWTKEPGPAPVSGVSLGTDGLSCADASTCVEVGAIDHYSPDPNATPAADPWVATLGGGSWHTVAVPEPSFDAGGLLWPISCPDPQHCTVFGSYDDHEGQPLPFAAPVRRDGWAAGEGPQPVGGGVAQPSCPTTRWCLGIGDGVQEMTGTAWRHVAGPPHPGGDPLHLIGLSCPVVRQCLVTGVDVTDDSDDLSEYAAQPWAAWWVDGHWQPLRIRAPFDAQVSAADGVSCPEVGWCEVIGGGDADGFFGRWVPFAWTVEGPSVRSDPFPDNGENEVHPTVLSCPAKDVCLTAGEQQQDPQPHDGSAYVARRDARGWRQIGPGPDDSTASPLFGVSCVDRNRCLAAGQQFDERRSIAPIVLSIDGEDVTPITIPDPPDDQAKGIGGVTCLPDATCLLAGDTTRGHPLLERIDLNR